jgi:hypothetical protein
LAGAASSAQGVDDCFWEEQQTLAEVELLIVRRPYEDLPTHLVRARPTAVEAFRTGN